MNPRYGRHRQAPIDVRKRLGAAFEILIDHVAAQFHWIDFKQHQIRASMEPRVRHSAHLMRVRAVNEAFRCEILRGILAGRRRVACFGRCCNVINPLHERLHILPNH